MASNPLGEDGLGGPPIEPTDGSQVINSNRQRICRQVLPDGTITEIPMDERRSAPTSDGTYNDIDLEYVTLDEAGNAFPDDPRKLIARSYSGLYITDPSQIGHCASWLHPPGTSRIFLAGQDGRFRHNGAGICNQCDQAQMTIYLALFIVSLGVLVGIWQGAGVF